MECVFLGGWLADLLTLQILDRVYSFLRQVLNIFLVYIVSALLL